MMSPPLRPPFAALFTRENVDAHQNSITGVSRWQFGFHAASVTLLAAWAVLDASPLLYILTGLMAFQLPSHLGQVQTFDYTVLEFEPGGAVEGLAKCDRVQTSRR